MGINEKENRLIPDTVSGEEDAAFVLLCVLYPHRDCKTISRYSVEWHYLSSTRAEWITEVQVEIDINS